MRRPDRERGSALLEFVFIAVIIFVPLVYAVVAVAVVERDRLAVAEAARDVGRAIAMTETADDPIRIAAAALQLSLRHHGLAPGDVELRYGERDDSCSDARYVPDLTPGAEFAVCVVRHLGVPAIPGVLGGGGVTVVGRYVVHLDDFRPGR
jgi:hypothetical protein